MRFDGDISTERRENKQINERIELIGITSDDEMHCHNNRNEWLL